MLAEQFQERRRFFRIEDEIILNFRCIEQDQVPVGETFQTYALDAFSLSSRLDLMTMESRSLLRKIERGDPDLAEFLKLIEQKIDLIGKALLAKEIELAGQPTRRVNMSACGIAFETDIAFSLGAALELKMLLPPALIGILAYGRVVYCRENRDYDLPVYHVAADFIGLRDQDRELLIRHVVKKQSQQLREKKNEFSEI